MLPDVQWVVFIWVITFSTFSHQPSLNSSQHHLDSTSKSKEGELVAGGCEGHWKTWGPELTHLAVLSVASAPTVRGLDHEQGCHRSALRLGPNYRLGPPPVKASTCHLSPPLLPHLGLGHHVQGLASGRSSPILSLSPTTGSSGPAFKRARLPTWTKAPALVLRLSQTTTSSLSFHLPPNIHTGYLSFLPLPPISQPPASHHMSLPRRTIFLKHNRTQDPLPNLLVAF